MDKPQTAKLFRNDRSQAVRLPATYRFQGDSAYITKVGGRVILSAKPDSWHDFLPQSAAFRRVFCRA